MAGAIEALQERLARGETILLDGATGTELERRGVPMVEGAWCGLANFTHPAIVREVHEAYIMAGADVVIANTFASSRHMLEPAGYGDRAAEGCRIAVRLAREAVARAGRGRAVAVAGSLSTARPVIPGTDRQDPGFTLTLEEEAANYREVADALAEAGADLIVLEMIADLDRGPLALEAALSTGLPVWLGLSVVRDGEGRVTSYREPLTLGELLDFYAARPIAVLGVMHSSIDDCDAALPMLRHRWRGPLMVYPEAGWFEAPHWRFAEVAPEYFARIGAGWVEQGVQLVGGCCGIGPEHIAALARRLGRPVEG